MTRTSTQSARLVFTARERLVIGEHVVEAGDVLDYDPSDGSLVLAARISASPLEIRDLLDRRALLTCEPDAAAARAELSPPGQSPTLRVIPIGAHVAVRA